MSTETKPPSKKWRVYGERLSNDYRSQSAAYGNVQALTSNGVAATVYHFEDGDWRLYERCEPVSEEASQ